MSQFDFEARKNPRIVPSADNSTSLKFYISKEDISDYEAFCTFVNGVKSMVRKDPRYINYKSYLYDIGLNRCQVFSNITNDMVPIEMHHGPLFTLFDICAMVTDHMLSEKKYVNSFVIADKVLTEHEKHNIQIVMLSEVAHEAAENGSIFISFKQGFGHIDRFIKKYKKGLNRDHYDMIKEYLRLSKENDATDNDIFKIIKRVKKYIKK